MCGICGIIDFRYCHLDQVKQTQQQLNRICQRLVHRGPDASNTSFEHLDNQSVYLGHRRLSIIDLSVNGKQPMHIPHHQDYLNNQPQKVLNNNCYSLVFNGCIYNYLELKQELKQQGSQFHSKTDTEVIIEAWRIWGENCIQKFDGMFAFALWDKQKQQLFLVRDRFGIKPLYYALEKGKLYFSSTLPSLLPEIENKNLNKNALHFMYHLHAIVPAPDTIIETIRKVPPAHFLSFRLNHHQKLLEEKKSYWQLPEINHQLSQTAIVEQTEYLLKEAVKKRLQASNVPVGILLSGGLDSSLITALTNDLKKEGEFTQNVNTFSIGFESIGHEKGDEFYYSDQVVKQFDTHHQKIIIENNQVLSRLSQAIENMSEPMFGQDAIAFYLLSEQVAKHNKVVLSGQGADEVFGGYYWYPQIHSEARNNDINQSNYDIIEKYYLDRNHQEWQQLISPQYQSLDGDLTQQWINKQFNSTQKEQLLAELLKLDVTTLIVDDPVKRVDNMTMAWSLEARVPFLDTALVEFSQQIPIELKLQNKGKGILKQIARKWFGDDFIYRQKDYFPMPALKYVQGDFLTMMKDCLSNQKSKERGLFNKNYINQLINQPENYFTRLQGSKLWHCALTELWLQKHCNL